MPASLSATSMGYGVRSANGIRNASVGALESAPLVRLEDSRRRSRDVSSVIEECRRRATAREPSRSEQPHAPRNHAQGQSAAEMSRELTDRKFRLYVAEGLAQGRVSFATIAAMIHEGVNEPHERDAWAECVAYGSLALAAVPTMHAFVGKPHATQCVHPGREAYTGRRNLEDIRPSPLVGNPGTSEEPRERLTVVAVANHPATSARRDAECNSSQRSTVAAQRNVVSHRVGRLLQTLDGPEA